MNEKYTYGLNYIHSKAGYQDVSVTYLLLVTYLAYVKLPRLDKRMCSQTAQNENWHFKDELATDTTYYTQCQLIQYNAI